MPPATIFVIPNLLDIQTDHYYPITIPKNNEQEQNYNCSYFKIV